jgi:tRNA pseudouridine38-40 synthase
MYRRYKAVVAYDGTDYHGWQAQPDRPTVVQTLQDTFATVFGRPISIVGVSRTDAGVHALNQIATFTTDLDVDVKTMRWAWHNRLPGDIILRSLELVPDTHNIYHNVAQKTYVYNLFAQRPLPFLHRYGWHIQQAFDEHKLQDALQMFVGTHDFRSFCAGDEERSDTVRTIDSITLCYNKRLKMHKVIVKGPAFLRYMIRRIVGASVAIAMRSQLAASDIKQLLERKNPDHTLPNAPAQGLVLYRIKYKEQLTENLT